MDVEELLGEIINSDPGKPNSFRIEFEEQIELKDLFELLLTFLTDICKLYYGDGEGIVDIERLGLEDIEYINRYFASIGFKVNILSYKDINNVSQNIIEYLKNNSYNQIEITKNTNLKELFFVLSKGIKLYKISFEVIPAV